MFGYKDQIKQIDSEDTCQKVVNNGMTVDIPYVHKIGMFAWCLFYKYISQCQFLNYEIIEK